MKVVLDTNVLVSALLTPDGICARILGLLVEGVFEACADNRILAEYEDVLGRSQLAIDREDADIVLELLRSTAEAVAALPLAGELPDPGDTPFLEVASTADALLVTGNPRHYPARLRGQVKVLAPREFIELLRHPLK